MKHIKYSLVFVALMLIGYISKAQNPDKPTIVATINTKVQNNPPTVLRGNDLNAILKDILNYPVDSIWISNDTLYYYMNGATKSRKINGGAPTGTAGGDLNGTYPNPTVDGLQGRAVVSTAPTNLQALAWSTTNNRWEPGCKVDSAFFRNDSLFIIRCATQIYSGKVNASGINQLTGDVTAGPATGSVAATIAANAVTNAKIRQSAGLSVIGNSTNATANVADITAANDAEVLRRNGTTLGFGTLLTGSLADDAVTYAKIQNVTAYSTLARISGTNGDLSEVTFSTSQLFGRGASGNLGVIKLGTNLSMSNDTLNASGGGVTDGDKGDITVTASGATWTIDNDVVTYAKMQNVSATSRFLGRITAGAGDAEELTGTQATTLLDVFTSTLKGLVPLSGGGTTNFLRADGTWAAPPGGGLADPGANGVVVRTALNTTINRTLTGTANQIVITNGDGVSGNPTFDVGTDVAQIDVANAWADGVKQTFNPSGTNAGLNVGAHTADPSSPANGDIIYQSTANELHARINGAWVTLGAGGASYWNRTGTTLYPTTNGDFIGMYDETAAEAAIHFTETTSPEGLKTTIWEPSNYNTDYAPYGRAGRFTEGWQRFNGVNASGRPNVVYYFGYNAAPGGGRELTDEASIHYRWESHYEQSGNLFELHTPEFTDSAGTTRRLMSWYVNKNGLVPTGPAFRGDAISFSSWANSGEQWLTISADGGLLDVRNNRTSVGSYPKFKLGSLATPVNGIAWASGKWDFEIEVIGDRVQVGRPALAIADAAKFNIVDILQVGSNSATGNRNGLLYGYMYHENKQTGVPVADFFQTSSFNDIVNFYGSSIVGAIRKTGIEWRQNTESIRSTSGTNDIVYPYRMSRYSTGTAAAGIGVGLEYAVQNGSGNLVKTGEISSILTTVTNAAEDAAFNIRTIRAGTLTDHSRFHADGSFSIGTTTADRFFHVEQSDAVTAAVTYTQRLTHISSGVVAANFGTGIEYELENASGTNRVAAAQDIFYTDATNATEDASFRWATIKAGTLTNQMLLNSDGELLVNTSTDAGTYNLQVAGAGFIKTTTADVSTANTVLRLARESTGTPAAGYGTILEFVAENGSGTQTIIGEIQSVYTVVTESAEDAYMSFKTVNGGAKVEQFRITGTGNVIIGGGTSFDANSSKVLWMHNGGVPSTSATNGIALYSEDVAASAELKVRDEAGNITTLSPHNFTGIPQGRSEEMAWAFYSEKDGKYVNVDMLKLARLMEKLTGEKLVYTGKINEKPNPKNK